MLPSKLWSRPATIRIRVDLPQPDGPISAPIRPASRRKARLDRTSTGWPEAFTRRLRATRTSSGARPPSGDMAFKGLHHEGFDHQHRRGERQGVGEEQGDVEQLEGDVDLKSDAV